VTAIAVDLADRTMSNGIQPLGGLQGGATVVPTDARATARSSPDIAASEPTTAPAPWYPNPSLHIDPALGIVIIEFHDKPGEVSSSIPTARQLAAYRSAFGQTAAPPPQPAVATAVATGTAPPVATAHAAPAAPASPADKAAPATA
jgi:hypothetical protein